VARIEEEADRRKVAVSDVVREAVEGWLNRDQRQGNAEKILSALQDVKYELVTNRAVILRLADMEGNELSNELLEEAKKDAAAYLAERKQRG
jgi:hypothetical protein